jgi:hypothetical protein
LGPPAGFRRVGVVFGGAFAGDRLAGEVLDGRNDWQIVREDGSVTLDVRLTLKAGDGTLIAMSYRGIRHGPHDVIARVEGGEAVDAGCYYFRIVPTFEVVRGPLDWLDRIVVVGIGHSDADGPFYGVFEIE